jgi:hypothetical protein
MGDGLSYHDPEYILLKAVVDQIGEQIEMTQKAPAYPYKLIVLDEAVQGNHQVDSVKFEDMTLAYGSSRTPKKSSWVLRSSEDWLRSLRTAQGLSEDCQGLPVKAQEVLRSVGGLICEKFWRAGPWRIVLPEKSWRTPGRNPQLVLYLLQVVYKCKKLSSRENWTQSSRSITCIKHAIIYQLSQRAIIKFKFQIP